ncbi:MAG: glycosyltransferase [Alphaproteobacteria bacterium]
MPDRANRKDAQRRHGDRMAPERAYWLARSRYFHDEDERMMRFLIEPGKRVLELGCGIGVQLAALRPERGVGIDISPGMIEEARRVHPESAHPGLRFIVGDMEDAATLAALDGPYDTIVLSDSIGALEDVEATFASLHALSKRDTRLVIAYYSWLWQPWVALAERLGLKMPQPPQNRLGPDDIANLLALADFEVIKRDWRMLVPYRLLGLGWLINRTLATLPMLRRLCLRHYLVARSMRHAGYQRLSTSVIIPARNERGNIAAAVERMPRFCDDIEIVFVEGHSRDGTLDEMKRVQAENPTRDIKVLVQEGKGKGDAVRKGFAAARGELLMILDADLTVPPETLPKFYAAVVSGKGEFVNGSRLVYPMARGAMRPLNLLGNLFFSTIFSWLLNQRFTDTLCGTKVLTKAHYERIAANRFYFGEFDPFGDFDLLFGAAKLNLKLIEVPIRYADRIYGATQISRFRHGFMLLKMVAFAYRKLKAF